MIGEQGFRDLMAAVCAQVTIVTAAEGGPFGTTVSAFASLSLRPPMITVALASRSDDRFAAADWHYDHGLPRLSGAPAWLACELAQAVEGGDHMLLVGAVGEADARTAPPLVYGHRSYGTHSGFAARPRRPVADLIAACSH